MRKALFIDRDGIFHRLVPWGGGLCAPRFESERFEYPEIQGIERVKELGFLLLLVTNQPDVERGITSRDFVERVNENYQRRFKLDGVYVCFDSSDDSPLKKPNPGMFLAAAKEWDLSLKDSFHLGDTDRDVEGAARAGIRSILWDREYNRDLSADYRVHSIEELTRLLQQFVVK